MSLLNSLCVDSRRCRIGARLSCLVLLVCGGCRDTYIPTHYGERTGLREKTSVNGTAVLGDLLDAAGHRVRSWQVLSPALREADVIVWAPDHFQLPDEHVQSWLDEWLRWSESHKHLVFIGRGYDGAIPYWQAVLPGAPQTQKADLRFELKEAQDRFDEKLESASEEEEWPGVCSTALPAKELRVSSLSGPWSEGIDSSKIDIRRAVLLKPSAKRDRTLLSGDGQPLVSQFDIPQVDDRKTSQVTLIDNGSFLLNVTLVNHEHRKLAARLVEAMGSEPKKIVFLDAGDELPEIRDTDPRGEMPTGVELFGVWPLSGVLLHLLVLGGLFALSCWPIFGLPSRLPAAALTDFGRHVRALGSLLKTSGDTQFASQSIEAYRQKTAPTDTSSSTHSQRTNVKQTEARQGKKPAAP